MTAVACAVFSLTSCGFSREQLALSSTGKVNAETVANVRKRSISAARCQSVPLLQVIQL